jgi:hypothetical protein
LRRDSKIQTSCSPVTIASAAEYVRAVALQKNLLQSAVKFSRTTVGVPDSPFFKEGTFAAQQQIGR